jgi:diaminopimelate decarboxylase
VSNTGFHISSGTLACDGVPLTAIADAVGTPVYVYSAALIRERYRALDDAFGDYPHAVHYALKANSTLAIARMLRELGAGADANSIWEIEVATAAGFAPRDIVFTGVGKSPHELEQAVAVGLKAINVESAGELARIESIAQRAGTVARVAIRINPDIDARSHPHISTGLKANKFGIALEEADRLFDTLPSRPALALVALHVHVGSQITTLDPFARAAALLADRSAALIRRGQPLEYLDIGGGLGISYDEKEVPTAAAYAATMLAALRPTGLPLVIEPGRSLVGPAGVLLARVVDIKPRDAGGEFALIDAGMTELMRPALYGAYHRIERVTASSAAARHYDIAGPVCESTDIVGRDRRLPALAVDDLVAIRDAGAYGAVMASNYNRRPLPPEVLVDGGSWRVVRRRQTVDDLPALET